MVGEILKFSHEMRLSLPVTVLHTSARACNWDVLTSGTLMALVFDMVLVVVVKLMHVLIDGNIGITGMTTVQKNI